MPLSLAPGTTGRAPISAIAATEPRLRKAPQLGQRAPAQQRRARPAAARRGSFDRPNLWFGVVAVRGERERLAALLDLVGGDDQMVIVYAPTRGLTEGVARALCRAGHRAAPYHAGLTRARRAATLDDFLEDRVDVIVATCAFGMGIDKPDVRLVVHWTLPATPEAYYQEAGRAGRDGAFARCVLLWRPGDAELHRRQLDVTFPSPRTLARVWADASRPGVPANVRDSAERLRHELHPERGPVDWTGVRERRRCAENRIDSVESYATGRACRRRALLEYFGERLGRCAGCDRCGGVTSVPRSAATRRRLAALRQALGGRRGPWGGSLIEPEVLRRLAAQPPTGVAALADVPGVGPALADRLGGTILKALHSPHASLPTPVPSSRLRNALLDWRARTAGTMGLPQFRILSDATIDAIGRGMIHDRSSLARLPGIGPRTLAKFGDELLQLVAEHRTGAGDPG